MSKRLHTMIAAVAATALVAAFASEASAANGVVNLQVSKGGVIVGGTSGTGTLRFRGRTYPLTISGAGAGPMIGGSRAILNGEVANIRRPSDIEGRYSSATGVATLGRQGKERLTLTNPNGAVLRLAGASQGLMLGADLGGLRIQLAGASRRR